MMQQRATYTYQVEGTPDEVHSQLDALRRAGELVRIQPARVPVPDGRLAVDATVYAHLTVRRWPQRPRRRRLVLIVSVPVTISTVATAGWVAGVEGADAIAQVVKVAGVAGALLLLLYALVMVRHRVPGHHCPGCRDH